MTIPSQFGDLFEKLGLQDLNEDEKQKYLQEWTGIVQEIIFNRLDSELTEEDRKKLESLDGNEFEKFLREKIPNFDAIALEETLRFREQLLVDSQYIRGRLGS